MPDSETRVIAPMTIIRNVTMAAPSTRRAKPESVSITDCCFVLESMARTSLRGETPRRYSHEGGQRNKEQHDQRNCDGWMPGDQPTNAVRVRRIHRKGKFPIGFHLNPACLPVK